MSNQQAGKAGSEEGGRGNPRRVPPTSSGSALVGLLLLFGCAAFGLFQMSGTLGLTPNAPPPATSSNAPAPQNKAIPQISNPSAVTVVRMAFPPDPELEEIAELFQHELAHLILGTSEQ